MLAASGCAGSGPPKNLRKNLPIRSNPANYVPDPSFERNLDFWAPYGHSQLIRSTRVHKLGSASVEVRFSGKRATPAYGLALPSVVGYPSKASRFRLSLWVRGPRNRRAAVELAESGGRHSTAITAIRNFVMNGRWQRVALAGTIRRNDRTSLDLYVIRLKNIAFEESFYVDDVILRGSF